MSESPGIKVIRAAAERLLPGGEIETVGDRSWLVSVATGDDRFSVRQLDPSWTANRVDLIHEFLQQPELQSATPLVGKVRTGTLVFDARDWVQGTAIGPALVSLPWRSLHLPVKLEDDQLGSIAASLGTLHRTGSNSSIVARAPHFKLKDAMVAARRALDLQERQLASEIRKESRARRWLTAARPLLTNAEQAFEQHGFLRDESEVIAHLDLWGSHIVAASDRSATFLDFSAIGAAPAAVDLAQLIARSGAWSDDRVERVLQRYSEEMPIAPLQRRMLPWLTAIDAIPTCGHLLARAHSEAAPLSDSDRRRVWAAADLQLELLATLAFAFVPQPPRPYRRQARRKAQTEE